MTGKQSRTRSGMTDSRILRLIESGQLHVCQLGRHVRTCRKRLAVRIRHRNGSSYRFVEICADGKKKKIAVHRLVWMSIFRRVVPAGFDVDHIQGKRIKNPDGIHNLRLLDSSINRSMNARLAKVATR